MCVCVYTSRQEEQTVELLDYLNTTQNYLYTKFSITYMQKNNNALTTK